MRAVKKLLLLGLVTGLTACGSATSPGPIGGFGSGSGYGGTCFNQMYNQGGYNYFALGFNGTQVYFDGSNTVVGGTVPANSGSIYSGYTIGQVMPGGAGGTQGTYQGYAYDGQSAVYMNLQSTYQGCTFGQCQGNPVNYPTANIQGTVFLAPQLVQAILYTFGGYNTSFLGYPTGYPGYGSWPSQGMGSPTNNWQAPQVCVTSIAVDLRMSGYSLNTGYSTVYMYINNQNTGTYVRF